MLLIEQGVQHKLENHVYTDDTPTPFPFLEIFQVFPANNHLFNGPTFNNRTRFVATDVAKGWQYGTILSVESDFGSDLLVAGWNRWQYKFLGISVYKIREIPEYKAPKLGTDNSQKTGEGQDEHHHGEAENLDESDGGPGGGLATPEGSTSPQVAASSYQTPGDTSATDSMLRTTASTPARRTIPLGSMSAVQSRGPRADTPLTSFRPRRQLSDPSMATYGTAHRRTSTSGLHGLNNDSSQNVISSSQGRGNSARVPSGGIEDDGRVFESADPTVAMEPPTHVTWPSPFTLPVRRSAAVPIKNPDGSLASLGFNKESADNRSGPASSRSNVADGNYSYTTTSSPSTVATTRRRSDSGPRPGAHSSSFAMITSSPPAKKPSNRLVNIASTIHEESESEHESGSGQNEDAEDVVLMNGGRSKNREPPSDR